MVKVVSLKQQKQKSDICSVSDIWNQNPILYFSLDQHRYQIILDQCIPDLIFIASPLIYFGNFIFKGHFLQPIYLFCTVSEVIVIQVSYWNLSITVLQSCKLMSLFFIALTVNIHEFCPERT